MVSSAARVGSINVLLQTDIRGGVAGLNTFATAVERTGITTQRHVSGIDRSITGMNRTLGAINARGFTGVTVGALRAKNAVDQLRGLALAAGVAVGGLVPAAIASSLVRTADSAHRLSNQLKTVTSGTADLKSTQDDLFRVSQNTRSSFDSTVTIYARTARAAEHLGLSQQKLLRITETVQKAFAVGGASSAEATGAAIQLSQGIASNRFSGDEFRSVAENAPVLLRGMAEAIGVNIGKLREMAHAGELTAGVVTRAIIQASDRIDAEFAKTTSTIEQAWVKIGNAVTKYVMDSDNASAASSAIVTVLNALSTNIDTVADSLLLLGTSAVSIVGGRILSSFGELSVGLRASRVEALAAAKANLQLALAQQTLTQRTLSGARAQYEMAKAGSVSASTRVRAGKELQAAALAEARATRSATAAVNAHNAAMRAASVGGMAYAAAGRAASAAWSFIGGPFGAALLLAGAAMYVVSSESTKAKAELDKMAQAGDKVTSTLARIEGRAKDAGDAIDRFAAGFRDLIKVEGVARAQSELLDLTSNVYDMGRQMQELARQAASSNGGVAFGAQITELTSRVRFANIEVGDYVAELQKLAVANPDQSKIIADLIDMAKEAENARSKIFQSRIELANLDGSEANVRINLTVDQKSDIANKLKEQAEEQVKELYKGGKLSDATYRLYSDILDGVKQDKPKKTRADEYERLIKRVRESTSSLQSEAEVQAQINPLVNDYGYALAKAATQHDLLNAAREAGKKITPEIAAEIAKEADQHASAAAAVAKRREEIQKLQEQENFEKGIWKEIISVVNDGKVSWQEMGDTALSVLDKIINKIEDELIDSVFKLGNTGGGGFWSNLTSALFGGGSVGGTALSPAVSSIMASGAGGLFDSGGVNLGGNIVPFGPKTKSIGSGVLADSGLGPRHFPAVLEYGETVLDDAMTNRTMDFMTGAIDRMGSGGSMQKQVVELHVHAEEGEMFRPTIRAEAAGVAVKVTQATEKARKNRIQNGASG